MAECKMDWSPVRMDTYRWTCRVCGESVERDSSAGHPYRACPAQTHPMTTDRDAALRAEIASVIHRLRNMHPIAFDDDLIEETVELLGALTPPTDGVMVPREAVGCGCRTCRPITLDDMRFVVCPDCGNKRCPRANDHRHLCTNSNAPGQPGSAFAAAPKQKEQP